MRCVAAQDRPAARAAGIDDRPGRGLQEWAGTSYGSWYAAPSATPGAPTEVRKTPHRWLVNRIRLGAIPARAGSPRPTPRCCANSSDHPRACGEHAQVGHGPVGDDGVIPARAGSTGWFHRWLRLSYWKGRWFHRWLRLSGHDGRCSWKQPPVEVRACRVGASGLGEGEEIRVGLVRGESLRQIARRLGRPVWRIAREVDRNGGRTRSVAAAAHRRAERVPRRPTTPRLVEDPALAWCVTRGLVEDRESPMTIARHKSVSHETITQAIHREDRGLDLGLWRHLHHRRRRRRRCPGEQQRLVLGQFRPIVWRPAAAAHRTQIGHLDGDLIIGARNASAAVTIVDRPHAPACSGRSPTAITPRRWRRVSNGCCARSPRQADAPSPGTQGRAMALWADIEQVLGTPITFADPHALLSSVPSTRTATASSAAGRRRAPTCPPPPEPTTTPPPAAPTTCHTAPSTGATPTATTTTPSPQPPAEPAVP